MTEPANPAARVRDVLSRVRSSPREPNQRTVNVWAEVLDVTSEANDPSRTVDIGRRLLILIDQLQLIRELAPDHTKLKPANYDPELAQLTRAFDPVQIAHNWNNVAQYLTDGTYKTMVLMADLLGDIEIAVSADTLNRLLDLVAEAERLTREDEDLSRSLRIFILRTLAAVRAAVQEYALRGAEALRGASQALAFGLAEFMPEVKAKSRSATLLKLLQIAAGVQAIVNAAGAFTNNVGHLHDAVTAIQTGIPAAAALLQLHGANQKLLTSGDQPGAEGPPPTE